MLGFCYRSAKMDSNHQQPVMSGPLYLLSYWQIYFTFIAVECKLHPFTNFNGYLATKLPFNYKVLALLQYTLRGGLFIVKQLRLLSQQ